MPKIKFIDDVTHAVQEVDAPIGMSLLEISRHHDIDIQGSCDGSLACATCHVVVDPAWYPLLPQATENEEDMLDLAFGLTQTSRLCCQLIVTQELDGLTVRIPESTHRV
jgi:2Fe-2S ferredoxin